MNQQLPEHPNLDHLRDQAKSLLTELRHSAPSTKLHHAQHQLAQSYGFPSWPKLVADVQRRMTPEPADLEALDLALTSVASQRAAEKLLKKKPWLKDASLPGAALALHLPQIKKRMAAREACKSAPIAYVAFSPVAKSKPSSYVSALKFALSIGQDANASIEITDFPGNPLSMLYAASGVARNPEATRLLLAHGAKTDDNESLYHSTESNDHTCLQILLEAGAKIDGTNALIHMLDREDLPGLELLLARKPNLDWPPSILAAVQRNRSAEIVRRLLEAGANPRAGEHGRTGAALAYERGYNISGLTDLDEPSETSQLLRACWMGDVEAARRLAHVTPSLGKVRRGAFAEACWAERAQSVEAYVAAGFTVADCDSHNATPLHCASYTGHLPTVDAVLKHKPDLADARNVYKDTPLVWAMHASQNNPRPMRDHLGVVKRLIEAGSPKPGRLLGSPEVREAVVARWPDLAEPD